jgi:hypothetical protein
MSISMINYIFFGELTKFPQNDNFWFKQDGVNISHSPNINEYNSLFNSKLKIQCVYSIHLNSYIAYYGVGVHKDIHYQEEGGD